MQRFFLSISDIHQFTRALRWNQQHLHCQHCNKHDQWVSHGFSYKQLSIDNAQPVGKRILCSNRFGRSGCGHTHRLYCADQIPFLHFSVSFVFNFLITLLFDQHHTVDSAYRLATGAHDTRNAWRWLNKLSRNIAPFRTLLLSFQKNTSSLLSATLSPLASTCRNLFDLLGQHAPELFQLRAQSAFL